MAIGVRIRPSGLDRDPRDFGDLASSERERHKPEPQRLAGKIEAILAHERLADAEAFRHKAEGTTQTHAHAARTNQGALARLFERGAIDKDQLAWACEISMVYEETARDVDVRIVSYEPRIDHESRGGVLLALESVMKARRSIAYRRWRAMLPMPKRLVLDMLVGEPIAFSTAARRYRMHPRKARSLLIRAIDRWPDCMEWACKRVDADDLAIAHARLMAERA